MFLSSRDLICVSPSSFYVRKAHIFFLPQIIGRTWKNRVKVHLLVTLVASYGNSIILHKKKTRPFPDQISSSLSSSSPTYTATKSVGRLLRHSLACAAPTPSPSAAHLLLPFHSHADAASAAGGLSIGEL
jgi:hypothetical protein